MNSEHTPAAAQPTPLWSDERIAAETDELGAYFDSGEVGKEAAILLRGMRSEYEYELVTLERKLQEARAWQPVPQSLEYDLITYAINVGELEQPYRICRLAPAAQEASVGGQDG